MKKLFIVCSLSALALLSTIFSVVAWSHILWVPAEAHAKLELVDAVAPVVFPPVAILLVASWLIFRDIYRKASERTLDLVRMIHFKNDPKGVVSSFVLGSGLAYKAEKLRRLTNKSARIRRRVDADDPKYLKAEEEVREALKNFWWTVDGLRAQNYDAIEATSFARQKLANIKAWRDPLKFKF